MAAGPAEKGGRVPRHLSITQVFRHRSGLAGGGVVQHPREKGELGDRRCPEAALQEAPGLPYLWSSETQGAEWRLPTQFSRPSAIRVWGPEACDVSLSEAGAGARLSTRTHRVLWRMLTDPRQPAENRRSSEDDASPGSMGGCAASLPTCTPG